MAGGYVVLVRRGRREERQACKRVNKPVLTTKIDHEFNAYLHLTSFMH
jgi:hypothetical protein